MGRGGQGTLTLQEHFPVTPASKALHFTNMSAKAGSTTTGVFSYKTAKPPTVLAWHCQMRKDQAKACTEIV